jgi:hypothetical protein
MPTDKQYIHYKLIDGRSGNGIGKFKVVVGAPVDSERLERLKAAAGFKKSCPVDMVEVEEYTPWKKRKGRLN